MAASSLNTVRVRLYFDYPPPGVSDCRMCWVLVDLNKCRVVADLASVIKEKFDFSRRTILNLFIDDCYLPPTESVYVVRDNDSIRVKLENQPPENGVEANRGSEGLSRKAHKRAREEDDENETVKIKKKKQPQTENQEVDPQPVRDEEKKKKKKKKKLKEKSLPVKPASPVKRTAPAKELTVSKSGAAKTAKKPAAAAAPAPSRAAKQKAPSSSSDTSDSSEEDPPKKTAAKPAKFLSSKPGGGVPAPARAGVAAAASSSSESSSDAAPGPAATKPSPKKAAPPTKDFQAVWVTAAPQGSSSSLPKPGPTRAVVKTGPNPPNSSSSSDSSSDSEPGLANRRPGLGCQIPPLATGPRDSVPLAGAAGRGRSPGRGDGRGQSPGRGRGIGRGDGRFPWRGGGMGGGPRGGQRGGPAWAGRGTGNHHLHSDQNGLPQRGSPQHASDTLTNKAVVLQNPPERAPKRDYASMPLLAAPPQVGQKIAFKLLELTENYTPEVSDYKEGKITGIDSATNQVELELLSSTPAPAEPGKFDLVYQTADGSEIVEYAVPRASQQLKERWESLLEPRLIVGNT